MDGEKNYVPAERINGAKVGMITKKTLDYCMARGIDPLHQRAKVVRVAKGLCKTVLLIESTINGNGGACDAPRPAEQRAADGA